MTSIAVIIPSSGAPECLIGCLEALAKQTRTPEDIVVVGPAAVAVGDALNRCIGARWLPFNELFSFSETVNRGIDATRSDWVLLLNDDVVLEPTFLERLLAQLPGDEQIGMACGKLLAADGRRLDSTGQFVSRARTAKERGHGEADYGQFEKPGFVFSAPAAAALYRRRMLEDVAVKGQYFDEQFGMYLEDLDLGIRAQRAGWRAYYVPGAVGRHMRGATAKSRRRPWPWLRHYYLPWLAPQLQARYALNRYALMAKHDSAFSLLKNVPWIVWYELKLWAYFLIASRKTFFLVVDDLRKRR